MDPRTGETLPTDHDTDASSGALRIVEATGRRTFLKVVAATGAAFAASAAASAGAATKKKATKTTAKATTTTKAAAKAAPATTAAPAATTPAAAAAGAFDLAVSFDYVVSDGFRARNPYIAVYVENPAEALVATLMLSLETGRGERWWSDLRRWFRDDQTRLAAGGPDVIGTITSATRLPGPRKVSWTGKDDAGAPVAAGEYFLCIESAREHGPYSLIREPVTIGAKGFTKKLDNSGELQNVSLELKPH